MINDLLNCCPTNRSNYEQLLRLLNKKVVVPFIGAGFSANMGYPCWKKFLELQARQNYIPKINDLLENNEFEKAALLLEEKIERSGLENVMLQNFGEHIHNNREFNAAFKSLPNLFQGIIITTNFDTIIETLYTKVTGEYLDKITPKTIKDRKVINQKLACGDPLLIKLHGDVAIREYVLTETDYNITYGIDKVDLNLPMPSVLKDMLKNKTLLFLGCSLEMDRTLKIIEEAKDNCGIAFAILPLPKSTENKDNPFSPILEVDGQENIDFCKRKSFLAKRNIYPIWYPYNKFNSLELLLQDMEKKTSNIFSISNTMAQKRLNTIFEEAKKHIEKKEIISAFYLYNEAEELLKGRPDIIPPKQHIDYLKCIKQFYSLNGYAYQKKEILKELIIQTEKYYGTYSLEMIRMYQEAAYYFEKYHYYKLMLKLFEHSNMLLKRYEEKEKKNINEEKLLISEKVFLYINLGYAYLKNEQTELSKKWYQEAKNLLAQKEKINASECAFAYNGLFRYYLLQNQFEQAIETLNIALNLRRNLTENENVLLPQHIINTHSNKIHIYLRNLNDIDSAMKEYEDCMKEPNIVNRLKNFPNGISRIKTDYGDILNKKGKYKEARKEYKEALNIKKSIQISEDLFSAKLYMKIAHTYYIEEKYIQALEYAIQAYIIHENFLGKNHEKTNNTLKFLKNFASIKGFENYNMHLKIQRELFEFRTDKSMKDRENQLIELFLPQEINTTF